MLLPNRGGLSIGSKPASTNSKYLRIILAAAILLRLVSAIYQGNIVTPLPGTWDQTSYDSLAQRVVSGYGFSFEERHWPATAAGQPTAHWSYVYTLFLAGVYSVFGHQPLVARVIQALVSGILHPWLTSRLAGAIFGPRVGLIAAGISAFYAYFFYYGGALITESFYFLGILWTLEVMLRLHRHGNSGSQTFPWKLWLEFGIAVALTGMMRQVFLVCVPLFFAWLWISLSNRKVQKSRSTFIRLQGMSFASIIIGLAILPWTLRNYRAFHTFVPLNTNAGFAFYWGNHPIYGTHFVGLLPGKWDAYTNLIPEELRGLNEGYLDRALLKRGLEFIKDDPARFVLLSVSRVHEYFKFWPTAESSTLSNICRVGSFGLCLPLMLYGIGISFHLYHTRRPSEPRSFEIVLLLLFVLGYTGIHLTSWALIRYRLPVDVILIIFAALGLDRLCARHKQLRLPSQAIC